MVIVTPFGIAFWICYLCGGLSDVVDGLIARKMNQQSLIGAKLDSIADVTFAVAIAIVVINNISLPVWFWLCALMVTVIRVVAYIIGLYKFRTFSSLHTYANKVTGCVVFAFPLFYSILGITISAIIIYIVAYVSALEELAITINAKALDRDCKTLIRNHLKR